MPTKITLSTNALIKLIELNGPEFQLELSNAVLNSACKKFAKTIVTEKIKEIIDATIKNEVKEQIGEVIESHINVGKLKLNIEFEKKIKSNIENKISIAITDITNEITNAEELKKKIVKMANHLESMTMVFAEKRINEVMAENISKQIDSGVQHRFELLTDILKKK